MYIFEQRAAAPSWKYHLKKQLCPYQKFWALISREYVYLFSLVPGAARKLFYSKLMSTIPQKQLIRTISDCGVNKWFVFLKYSPHFAISGYSKVFLIFDLDFLIEYWVQRQSWIISQIFRNLWSEFQLGSFLFWAKIVMGPWLVFNYIRY